MAVPQQKRSKAKTRSRKSANIRKSMPGISYCGNCEAPKPPHRVCPTCGYFDDRRGRSVETEFAGPAED